MMGVKFILAPLATIMALRCHASSRKLYKSEGRYHKIAKSKKAERKNHANHRKTNACYRNI
jgi:hypothetical protein